MEVAFEGHVPFTLDQRRLIGAYFLHEYSFEAAALFNPSIVRHWDQSGLKPGAVRFILSLRGIGEGHVSSVTFRTGVWDGALGVFEACGTRQSAFLAEVQVEGSALVMAADDYRRMYEASEALRTAVHKYVEILLTEARQFVACNALHSVEARLCRSVLEALERSRDGRTLPATQEVLAQMLGVQRTTVTAAISRLQASGSLRSTRGALEVLDAGALERAACCCRDTLRMARSEIYASGEAACDE